MAKNDNDMLSKKEMKQLLDTYLFRKPKTSADGTISTERYKTGIVKFDELLGGGLPKGRAVAIGAEWGVGKTTLLIQSCGNIVEAYDKKAYYLDAEGGATYELFEAMGYADLLYDPETNPEGKLILLSVTTIQQIARIIKQITKDPDTAVIVIDSDTQVTDQLAIDDDELGTGKNDVGGNARMWSKVTKPLNAILTASEACLLVVHQARVNLKGWMPRIESASGNAMKHLASVEIWGKRKEWIGEDMTWVKKREEAVGAYVKLTTEKNRLTKPFAMVEVPIFFGRGVSNKWAYRDWMLEREIADQATGEVVTMLAQKGAYFTLTLPSGITKCHGVKQMWEAIDAHYEEIVNYVEDNGGFTPTYIKGKE